jgi:hypothetical protein
MLAVMGNPMGMMGMRCGAAAPKTAADLERTTGFEPATLTLARRVGRYGPPGRT